VHAELAIEILDVGGHRVERHAELVRNLHVAATACERAEHVGLASGERYVCVHGGPRSSDARTRCGRRAKDIRSA